MAILPHILLLSPFILTAIGTGQNDERPLVATKYGQLRGVTVSVKNTSRAIDVFYGIPFAKPPVGPLRFANPEPPEPWSSVRDASVYPPMCIQAPVFMSKSREYYQPSFKMPPTSEDCLYLDVYTPADRDKETKLPVMIFIPGGALLFGTASTYDGSALGAYENVVVVIIQYRLGILGFFSTGDDQLPGNYGFLDQVAALQWIQENIADFGGDPTSITVFGQSAGGDQRLRPSPGHPFYGLVPRTVLHIRDEAAPNLCIVVLSPLAKGLFHRAIAESGAATMPGLVVSNSEELIPFQNLVAEISGCDFASIADCLKKKSEEEFLAMAIAMGMIPFPACVDGVFLPKPVAEILVNKEGNRVPFLIGINNQEFGWILPLLFNITGIKNGMTRETVMETLQNIPMMPLSAEVLSVIVDEYLGDSINPPEIRDLFLDLCGDAMFVIPALKIAKGHQDMGLPVYFYEFQHPPYFLFLLRPKYVKADHADELVSVLGGPFLRKLVFYSGPATPKEKVLSKTIMKYWANFARTGNPNSPDLTTWPEYGTDEHYLGINLQQKSSSKLKEDKFKFWNEILPGKIQTAGGGDHGEL